jgi:hypothetical protein
MEYDDAPVDDWIANWKDIVDFSHSGRYVGGGSGRGQTARL